MSTSVKVDVTKANEKLKALAGAVEDMTPILREATPLFAGYIQNNFKEHGRPTPWKAHSKNFPKGTGILTATGRLAGSFREQNAIVDSGSITLGSNVKYAATHQFGAAKGSFGTVAAQIKGHSRKSRNGGVHFVSAHTRRMVVPWGDIPARPMLYIAPDEIDEGAEFIEEAILRRVNG